MNIDWSKTRMPAIGALVANFNHPKGYGHIEFIYSPSDRGRYREGPASWEYHHAPSEISILEWDGEDRPPVGAICLLRTKRENSEEGGWGNAEIRYSSETALVWKWEGREAEFGSEWEEVEFRQIRTAEQIAAEKEISHMIDEAMDGHMCLTQAEAEIVCAQLHKAGYRKQVQE